MKFEIGHLYKDAAGNNYIMLSRDHDIGVFNFNRCVKRYKIIKYCGVEAAISFGKVLFKSANIIPQEDPEIDKPKQPVVYKLNNNNERYLDVLKSHLKVQ